MRAIPLAFDRAKLSRCKELMFAELAGWLSKAQTWRKAEKMSPRGNEMLVQREFDVKRIVAARSTSQQKQEAVGGGLTSQKQDTGSESRRPSSLSDVETQNEFCPAPCHLLWAATSVSAHVINATFLQLFRLRHQHFTGGSRKRLEHERFNSIQNITRHLRVKHKPTALAEKWACLRSCDKLLLR